MRQAGWQQRALGATLALLVQASFLLLVLLSPSRPAKPLIRLARETILLLRPLARPAPTTIDARGPARPVRRMAAPVTTAPPTVAQSLAPPSGLAGFGQALFGCAPEHYADLPPDQRAHCPKPGEGITRNTDDELPREPRSHAKYEARWQEQWDEQHWMPAPCRPGEKSVAQCLLDQDIAENRRAEAGWSRITADEAAASRPKAPPMPPRP